MPDENSSDRKHSASLNKSKKRASTASLRKTLKSLNKNGDGKLRSPPVFLESQLGTPGERHSEYTQKIAAVSPETDDNSSSHLVKFSPSPEIGRRLRLRCNRSGSSPHRRSSLESAYPRSSWSSRRHSMDGNHPRSGSWSKFGGEHGYNGDVFSEREKSPNLSEDEDGQKSVNNIIAGKVDSDLIFGNTADISSSDNENEGAVSPENRSHNSSRFRSRSRSCSIEPVKVKRISETRLNVECPRKVIDLGKEINFVKFPNFLSVETRPFHPETYEDENDDGDNLDEEGRQRVKLKVSNTIRWREVMNSKGEMVKESNARFVRWSDGSITLHLGNEKFDVYKNPLQADHDHLFVREGTGLQGQTIFRNKLTFRPHSIESFTHKKLTLSAAERSQKLSGIKILTQVGNDPDSDRVASVKKAEEMLRQVIRVKKPQPRRTKIRPISQSEEYGEDTDDENAISLNAIKGKFKKGDQAASVVWSNDSSDQDDDPDFKIKRSNKVGKTKIALRDSDSDEERNIDKA